MVTESKTVPPNAGPMQRPFPDGYVRREEELRSELSQLLLSAAGWRKIFANGEESFAPEITDSSREIVAVGAYCFARFLKERSANAQCEVAVATDTRPTGPAIADVVLRVLLSEGLAVQFLHVAAGPEVMAYVRQSKLVGFVYVTASHNPIGHNGLKFGLADGGVMGGTDAQTLVAMFSDLIRDQAICAPILFAANSVSPSALAALYDASANHKRRALDAYERFTREVVTGLAGPDHQEELIASLRSAARRRGIGVIADLNGSARTLSIDERFLHTLGVKVRVINGRPGEIVHRIVPEGESLEPCRAELERAFAQDAGFLFGYVPDNDGDRGNIVFMNSRTGRAEILHAQDVFALSCIAELSHLVYSKKVTYTPSGRAEPKVAVVVNDPTSLRIDAIAKCFDARVFRAEVGEANVVNLARDSRKSGFTVRILGEGSNGGNITHPAAVRDPINTLAAFLKLLLIESTPEQPGLFEIWCRRSGQEYLPEAGIPEIVATLPKFVTTDVFEPRAEFTVSSLDQVALKERFEEIFVQEWERKKDYLRDRLGVATWEEINYEGINEIHGFGRTYRSGKQRGGLKILFKDEQGRGVAFIWMRGSSTEPLFRVLADVRGDDRADEEWLLEWLIGMLERADR